MKRYFSDKLKEQRPAANAPAARPARYVKIAQTSIDTGRVDECLDSGDIKGYLDAIGNQGRWLLLQQMKRDAAMKAFLPPCADDLIQNTIAWDATQVDFVDFAISKSKVPLVNADKLLLTLGESVINIVNQNTENRVSNVGDKRQAVDDFVAPPAKKQKIDLLLQRLNDLEHRVAKPSHVPDIGDLNNAGGRVSSQPTPAEQVLEKRIEELQQKVDAMAPQTEVGGRRAMYNVQGYNQAWTPDPAVLRPPNNASATALSEVHKWLQGNSSIPSFARMWRAAQKNNAFNPKDVSHVRGVILWLETTIRSLNNLDHSVFKTVYVSVYKKLEQNIPGPRFKDLVNQFTEVQRRLNNLDSSSIPAQTSCTLFCESVVEAGGFTTSTLSILDNGVVRQREAKLIAQNSLYQNSYNGGGKNSNYTNRSTGRGFYNKKGPATYFEKNNTWVAHDSRRKNPVCFWCGQPGHYVRNCRYKEQGVPVPIDRFCIKFNAGSYCPGTAQCHKVHRCDKCRGSHAAVHCAQAKASLLL